MRSALAVCTGKRRRMRTRHHVAFPAWCLSGRKSKIDATRYFRCLGHGLHGFETSYHTPGVHAVGACVFYLLCARTRCLEYNHDAHQRFKIVPVPTIFITVRFFARTFSFALFNSDNDNNPAHATAKWYKCVTSCSYGSRKRFHPRTNINFSTVTMMVTSLRCVCLRFHN